MIFPRFFINQYYFYNFYELSLWILILNHYFSFLQHDIDINFLLIFEVFNLMLFTFLMISL